MRSSFVWIAVAASNVPELRPFSCVIKGLVFSMREQPRLELVRCQWRETRPCNRPTHYPGCELWVLVSSVTTLSHLLGQAKRVAKLLNARPRQVAPLQIGCGGPSPKRRVAARLGARSGWRPDMKTDPIAHQTPLRPSLGEQCSSTASESLARFPGGRRPDRFLQSRERYQASRRNDRYRGRFRLWNIAGKETRRRQHRQARATAFHRRFGHHPRSGTLAGFRPVAAGGGLFGSKAQSRQHTRRYVREGCRRGFRPLLQQKGVAHAMHRLRWLKNTRSAIGLGAKRARLAPLGKPKAFKSLSPLVDNSTVLSLSYDDGL